MSTDLITAAPVAGNAQGGFGSMFFMLGVFFVVSYFMLWRPQSKRAKQHRELMNNLQKGDEVTTTGGLVGRVSKISANFMVLTLNDTVEVTVQKAAVTGVLPKGTLKAEM